MALSKFQNVAEMVNAWGSGRAELSLGWYLQEGWWHLTRALRPRLGMEGLRRIQVAGWVAAAVGTPWGGSPTPGVTLKDILNQRRDGLWP